MKSHEDRAVEHYLALINADPEGAIADPISTAQEAWRRANAEAIFRARTANKAKRRWISTVRRRAAINSLRRRTSTARR